MCIKEIKNKRNDSFPFTSRFTSSMIMRDQRIYKGLLGRILPDVDFEEVRSNEDEILALILEDSSKVTTRYMKNKYISR